MNTSDERLAKIESIIKEMDLTLPKKDYTILRHLAMWQPNEFYIDARVSISNSRALKIERLANELAKLNPTDAEIYFVLEKTKILV